MCFFRLASLIGVLMVALMACSPVVYTDTDAGHDFSTLRTFTWAQTPPVITSGEHPISPLAKAKMTAAIRAEFERKGYRFVRSGPADFAVSYTLGARDKIELRQYPASYVSSYNSWVWGGRYYGVGYRPPFGTAFPTTREVEVTVGTLSVDAFDTRSRRPIWHEQASRRLSQAELAGQSDTLLVQAARTVLSEFPLVGGAVE